MNEYDVRLRVVREIRDLLVALAVEDEVGEAEVLEIEESMTDAADLLLEAIGFEVVSIDGAVVTARINLPPE